MKNTRILTLFLVLGFTMDRLPAQKLEGEKNIELRGKKKLSM